MVTVNQLSGRQKAAALLIALGSELSSKIMKYMDQQDVERLTFEILNLERVPQEVTEAAIRDCRDEYFGNQPGIAGGSNYAQEVLERALGPQHAAEVLGKISASRKRTPFEFLRAMDPNQLTTFLQAEHPQTIALILAHLEPRLAGAVLTRFDGDLQADVASRIGAMGRSSPEVVNEVQDVLKRRLSSVIGRGDLSTAVGGVECLVRILGQSNRSTEKTIVTSLETAEPELAEEVKKHMFVFEDITHLDDRSVQRVLREVEGNDLALSLRGVREDLKNQIMKNMSARAAQTLAEDIASLGPVRLRSVEEAQQRIVATVRRLDEAEEITISRGGEADAFI